MKSPPARPLYLNAQNKTEIKLDGPALKIIQNQRAPQWIPLSRISRVIIHGNAQWHAKAISACLQEGILIVLSQPSQGVTGWIVPNTSPASACQWHLHELALRPEWQTDIDNWHKAEERRSIRILLRRFKIRHRDLRPHHLLPRIYNFLDRGWKGATRQRLQQIKPLATSLILQNLRSCGTPTELLATPSKNSLMHKFWEIMRWDILLMLSHDKVPSWRTLSHKSACQFFEDNAHIIEKRIHKTILSLEDFLIYLSREKP